VTEQLLTHKFFQISGKRGHAFGNVQNIHEAVLWFRQRADVAAKSVGVRTVIVFDDGADEGAKARGKRVKKGDRRGIRGFIQDKMGVKAVISTREGHDGVVQLTLQDAVKSCEGEYSRGERA